MHPLHQQLLDAGAKPEDIEKLKAHGIGHGEILGWFVKSLPSLLQLLGSLQGAVATAGPTVPGIVPPAK